MGKRHLTFETASLTDVGRIRENNEDSLFAFEETLPCVPGIKSRGIYLIADGMGGHNAGEIASGMASKVVPQNLLRGLLSKHELSSPIILLKTAIEKANREIIYRARGRKELYSMGTTLTVGLRLDNYVWVGHVGDSRAYLLRKQAIEQLTEDHSVVAQLVKEHVITPEQAIVHPERNVILRSLGVSHEVKIDIVGRRLQDGDSLVFCSDGLTSCVLDAEISRSVRETDHATEACKKLIELANSRGGEDNTSVIVVKVAARLP